MHSAFTWQPLCYTESFPPPPFYSSLGKQQQKKTLFCFALHLSFWRLWWFFWWRSIVFATVALDELPEVNVQITSTRSDRIFFVPLFNIFFLFGNNNRSAVGGGWRRSSDGPRTTPPSTSSCDFRTKLLQRPKKQKKLTRSTMPVILPRAEKLCNRSIITQFLLYLRHYSAESG